MYTGPLFAGLTPEQRGEAARFLLDAKKPDGKPAVEFRFVTGRGRVFASLLDSVSGPCHRDRSGRALIQNRPTHLHDV
jgi:hypothetical protein